jgi:hypothetical protein
VHSATVFETVNPSGGEGREKATSVQQKSQIQKLQIQKLQISDKTSEIQKYPKFID